MSYQIIMLNKTHLSSALANTYNKAVLRGSLKSNTDTFNLILHQVSEKDFKRTPKTQSSKIFHLLKSLKIINICIKQL